MRGMTLEKIAEAVEGKLFCTFTNDTEAESVVIDSRLAGEKTVFVAIKGERSDGHDYIDGVFEKGALGVICEKLPENPKGPCIVVESSYAALRLLAKYYRSCMASVKIVGIVGSVGKTSTKELVATVLEQRFNTLKTQGNFNNEVGVPLTIFRMRDEHEVAVVEMGINHFGEMTRLGEIVRPDAVVMTNIGHAHLENLIDLNGVLKAKTEVVPFIKQGGLLVLNAEDEKLSTLEEPENCRIVRFGKGGAAEAVNVKSLGLEGSTYTVAYNTDKTQISFEARINLIGEHMIKNSLAATVIGTEFGMTPEEIARGIAAAKPVGGRSNLIKTDKYMLVDDCYNANPDSDRAAIDLLKAALGRKCAILGDMLEMGEDSARLHAQVGAYAAEQGVDILVCIGPDSKYMHEAAVNAGCPKVYYFETKAEFFEKMEEIGFTESDTILIKASHGMGFAEIVERLKNC